MTPTGSLTILHGLLLLEFVLQPSLLITNKIEWRTDSTTTYPHKSSEPAESRRFANDAENSVRKQTHVNLTRCIAKGPPRIEFRTDFNLCNRTMKRCQACL